MYKKISITGKANSGKNTLSKLIKKELFNRKIISSLEELKYLAFADPVKEIALKMFPEIKRKDLFGSSDRRSKVIEGAFKDQTPLTIRQLLIDIGNGTRKYNPLVWVNNLITRSNAYKNKFIIVTDTRFLNEFKELKNNSFFMVKICRDNSNKINDVSELEQDLINDDEYDFIINNNSDLVNLKKLVVKLVDKICS